MKKLTQKEIKMYRKDNKTEDWKDLIDLESIDTTKFDELTS